MTKISKCITLCCILYLWVIKNKIPHHSSEDDNNIHKESVINILHTPLLFITKIFQNGVVPFI
jgi:hypothetical protein